MKAEVLVFVSNVMGVLQHKILLPKLTIEQAEQLITDEVITDGMIPKVRSAIEAVQGGVAAVRITNLDGLKNGTGTIIVAYD
jgi:acetylglutamate kinase